MVHHRIYVSSEGSTSKTRVSCPITDYTTLNDFAEKAVNVGLEWITPVAASDTSIEYGTYHFDNPLAAMLCLRNVRVLNQYTSWSSPNVGSVLALLPAYAGTGYFGLSQDSPYLQSSALCLISHGDDLRAQNSLDFEIVFTGSAVDETFRLSDLQPAFMEDWAASVVFWTVEPERPLVPFDFFHIWLSTKDRSSGAVADCEIPLDLTTLSMYSRQDGEWNIAVSYVTPVDQRLNSAVASTRGLILESPTFSTSRANRPVLAFLNRSHIVGEERFFGYRQSVKPVNSDCVGLPLRQPLDNLTSVRLRLLNALTYATPLAATFLSDYTVCLTAYRVK